jgi:hypothetical protein
MKGYNLPDNVSPSDPEAPWNEEELKPKAKDVVETDCCGLILPKSQTVQCEECKDYLCKEHGWLYPRGDMLLCHLCRDDYDDAMHQDRELI